MSMAYQDLTLVEWSATDLVARAVDNLQARFPQWRPLEGDITSLLLEEFAKIAAEAVYAANRAPGIVMESLLLLYGVTRDPGAQAHATLRFVAAPSPMPRTVPAGTRVLVGEHVLTTDLPLTIPADASSGDMAATSLDLTSAINGAGDLAVALLDAVAYIDAVQLVGTPTDGRDPEELGAYLDRGASTLSRLTSTLVRADQFATAARADTRVSRAVAVDLYDPSQTPPTPRPGHITVAVLGQSGALLSPEVKGEIAAALSAQAVAMLSVHVIDATIQSVPISVNVQPVAGWVAADVRASVADVLRRYLDAQRWAYGATVYRNELISVIDQAPGVERVIDLTAPTADVALSSAGALATLGALTVKVAGVAP